MNQKQFLNIIIAGLACACMAGCGQNQDEISALRKKAKRGDAKAQYDLGSAYYAGKGIPTDYAEAATWWRKAAEQGNAKAQYRLGIYLWPQGKPNIYDLDAIIRFNKDLTESIEWVERAAKQGEPYAQLWLGDPKWLQAAVEQTNVLAAFWLGRAYSEGQGVLQDNQEAIRLFEFAAQQGCSEAYYPLACAYYKGNGVPQDTAKSMKLFGLVAEQDVEDQTAFYYNNFDRDHADRFLKSKDFRLEKSEAQFILGNAYSKGEGLPQNTEEAARLWRLAAEVGHKDARFYFTLYQAQQGNSEAQYQLGCSYDKDDYKYSKKERLRAPRADIEEAKKWWCKAAEQGHAEAQYSLGLEFVNSDAAEGVKWFRMAAEQGHHESQYWLANVYAGRLHDNVPRDIVQAYVWSSLAALQKNSDAERLRARVLPQMTESQIETGQQQSREVAKQIEKNKGTKK